VPPPLFVAGPWRDTGLMTNGAQSFDWTPAVLKRLLELVT
jgi:hypothetical protein